MYNFFEYVTDKKKWIVNGVVLWLYGQWLNM